MTRSIRYSAYIDIKSFNYYSVGAYCEFYADNAWQQLCSNYLFLLFIVEFYEVTFSMRFFPTVKIMLFQLGATFHNW